MQQVRAFDNLVQQHLQLQQPQSLTYLSANAGLVADASMLAAAAAALLPQQMQAAGGAAECRTPLSCVSDASAGAANFGTGIMAMPAAVAGSSGDAANMPSQRYWVLQHGQQGYASSSSLPTLLDGAAGMGGLDTTGSTSVHTSGNLMALALASVGGSVSGTPVGTPTTYMHQGLANPQAAFGAAGLCCTGSELSRLSAACTSGWL